MKSKDLWSISNLKIGSPFFIHNVKIHPIEGKLGDDGFTTLEEAIINKSVILKDTHGVDKISIQNNGERPVFAIDGEELLGARQNRILNVDVYIEPQKEYVVPVTCIEQHRWAGSPIFSEGGFTITPTLRSTLAQTVKESLEKKRGFKSNQSLIWSQIDSTLKATKVSSLTSSFHDIYKTLNDVIEELMEGFETIENSIGFLAYVKDEFIGCDFFGSNSIYRRFEKKLLKSYILDGYIRRYVKGPSIPKSPEEVINLISDITLKKHKSPTEGEVLIGSKESLLTKVFSSQGNLLHVAAFPSE
ncbi:MAG: hypothetical protein QMD82_02630 [bacterium]|nr:hypothetical protein [bacterium]